ncbi:uncharacterized protein LOC130052836 isoform X2 [Ostrea edulis]|uniref:uncharacterized protein LOC130052836 isoform X2 n=1 Tax=Ostrea edulis TaxID=37623 RepID=UPI0024AF6B4C|nr:uncharacterized protein LOC130052836 isoform X2 [Ostrea edulis]XP_056014906.1 uncharacterized protein LOC130052836 isoform X2 [Ostrea edulis]
MVCHIHFATRPAMTLLRINLNNTLRQRNSSPAQCAFRRFGTLMNMTLLYFKVIIAASACLLDIKILVIGEGCTTFQSTAKIVQACPKTAAEWATAASKKGCHNIKNSCGSFEYHCVMNVWQNETIEVCSKVINIVGNVCTEYSFGGRRIQRNRDKKCATCPAVYKSNESYKYSECYNQAHQRRKTTRPNISTSSSVYTINEVIILTSSPVYVHIQAGLTSESQIAPNINHTNVENQKLESSPRNTVLLGVGISGAITVIIICLILVAYRFCKDKEYCSLKGIFSSLFKTKYESQTLRKTDIDVEDNEGKLEDERFTEEYPLAVDIV